MGRLSVVLAALAIMVLGFVATLTMLADEERARSLLAAHAERQLGRQLQIDGSITVRYFPRLRIEARDIRLSGRESVDGLDLLESEQLNAEIRLLPLLFGRVETSEFALKEARLNLLMDEAGGHSFAGLLRHQQRTGAPGIVADGPLRLENLELKIGSLETELLHTVAVERIELDGLAFDRTLQLRFEGAIGSPPLIEQANLTGLVFLPAGSGDFRIADMVLTGKTPGAYSPFELAGQLDVGARIPVQMKLQRGQLTFAEQQISLEGTYVSKTRPFFEVRAMAESLDASAAQAVAGFPPTAELLDWLAALTAVHDFAVNLDIAALRVGELSPMEVVLEVVAADGMALLEGGRVALPGALADVDADLKVEAESSLVSGRAQIEIDDLSKLLDAVGFPVDASGVGQILLETADAADSPALARGEVRLLDGRLDGLAALRGELGLTGADAFTEFEGRFMIYDETIEFSELRVHHGSVRLDLDGLVTGSGQFLSGEVVIHQAALPVRIEQIRGTLANPEVGPVDSGPSIQ